MSATFFKRGVNPRFNAYRKQSALERNGKSIKFLMVKTDDATGKVTEIRYDYKGNITSKLKTEKYEKIDKDTFIGADNFVVIFKESWG